MSKKGNMAGRRKKYQCLCSFSALQSRCQKWNRVLASSVLCLHLLLFSSSTSTISLAFSLLPLFLSFISLLYAPFSTLWFHLSSLCHISFPIPSSTFSLISISVFLSLRLFVLPFGRLFQSLTLFSTHLLSPHISPPSVNHPCVCLSFFFPTNSSSLPPACCIIQIYIPQFFFLPSTACDLYRGP